MPKRKGAHVEGPTCKGCGQSVRPVAGAVIVSGKVARFVHSRPGQCPKGDPLYDDDVQ